MFKVRGIVANLPECGHNNRWRPRLITSIVQMADKEPRKTFKDIKDELCGQGASLRHHRASF